jgi:iron complex outermembrane receptor protein
MTSLKRWGLASTAMAALIGAAPFAVAQTATPAPTPSKARAGIEEVVVTARRRRESAQTAPVAVVALSAANITQQGIVQVSDLDTQVPGFRFSSEGGANNNDVILRGLSRIPIGLGLPAVVTYEDDVPLPGIASNRPIYDLANIQVLKGPQGTLFGRNTLGGAVLLNTVLPTDKISGFVDGTYGNYNNRQLDAAINIPVIPDVLEIRVAGHYRRQDGYVTSLNGGPALSTINENAGRVTIVFKPTDYLKNTTVYDYTNSPDSAAGELLYKANPGVVPGLSPLIDPQIAGYLQGVKNASSPWHQYGDQTGAGAAFSRDTGVVNDTRLDLSSDLTIRNIFGYQRVYDHEIINTGAVPQLTLFGVVPFTLFDAAQLVHQEYTTDEVQVLGKALDNKLNWIVGGFYNGDDAVGAAGTQFTAFSVGAVPSLPISSLFTDHNYAIYGQGGLDLSDWVLKGLTFNLGYRYTWDEVHACGGTFPTLVTSSVCEAAAKTPSPGGPGDIGAEGSEPSWTIGLDYKLSPHQFFYITSRRGYRGVGVNTPLFSSIYTTGGTSPLCVGPGNQCPDLRPFQKTAAEKLTDVEIGSKSDFTVDGIPVRFDIDGFWSKYKNALQFFNVLGTGIYTGAPDLPNDQSVGINAASETILGSELGLTVRPVPELTVSLNGSYVNATIDSITAPSAPGFSLTPAQVTLPSPRFSGSASFVYSPDVHLLQGDVVLSGDWYQTGHFGAQDGQNFPGYGVGNMRLALNNVENKGVDIAVFAKNILNRAYKIGPVVALPSFPISSAILGAPQEYGVELHYGF